jgi:hypothetical protein
LGARMVENLSIEQGSTFKKVLQVVDLNGEVQSLVGCDARMKIKTAVTALTTLCDMTTGNSKIVLNPSTGEITLNIAATETATFPAGTYVYDLEFIRPDSSVEKIRKGTFQVTAEVTT